jgi:exonuclease III
MKIATWNLNHRVGKTLFFPQAASAIGSLSVDVLVLTEYFPNDHHDAFAAELANHGFSTQMLSRETAEKANRVLIAAKQPFEVDSLALPDFDHQLPANVLAVRFSSTGLRLLGMRVPYYTKKDLPRVLDAWAWLEIASETLRGDQAIIVGDLNVETTSRAQRGGNYLRRILAQGWTRAQPTSGVSYYGRGGSGTEIDHALCSPSLKFASARYQTAVGDAVFAGNDFALSDHAVLMVEAVRSENLLAT